eukprot:scaffold4172_cov67-Cyclotella_meneghiniana.AAC.11
MANAQKPTSRTRHMDIRYFALSDWVEQDLMTLERIHTSVNIADHFTKPLERTLFYRHVDYIMGHIPPAYSPCYTYATGNAEIQPTSDIEFEDMVVKPPVARAAKCELQLRHWLHIVACTKAHAAALPLSQNTGRYVQQKIIDCLHQYSRHCVREKIPGFSD